MPRVTFVDPAGAEHNVEGENGQSLMQVAKNNDIDGIVAECGGSCACATCHVYVGEAWRDVVGGPSADESDMLDFAYERRPESRLSCQIRLRPELDGLVVQVPERQN